MNPVCHPDRKYQGNGLCGSCYQMWWRKKAAQDPFEKERQLVVRRVNYKKRRNLNPEREKAKNRSYVLAQYGLTIQDYDRMYLLQKGLCSICSTHNPKLHVDHNHSTGAVRGLLCHHCNAGLGHFKDRQTSLREAERYLFTHSIVDTWTNFVSAT